MRHGYPISVAAHLRALQAWKRGEGVVERGGRIGALFKISDPEIHITLSITHCRLVILIDQRLHSAVRYLPEAWTWKMAHCLEQRD
jgi:preprotein translocase subunit YajC